MLESSLLFHVLLAVEIKNVEQGAVHSFKVRRHLESFLLVFKRIF